MVTRSVLTLLLCVAAAVGCRGYERTAGHISELTGNRRPNPGSSQTDNRQLDKHSQRTGPFKSQTRERRHGHEALDPTSRNRVSTNSVRHSPRSVAGQFYTPDQQFGPFGQVSRGPKRYGLHVKEDEHTPKRHSGSPCRAGGHPNGLSCGYGSRSGVDERREQRSSGQRGRTSGRFGDGHDPDYYDSVSYGMSDRKSSGKVRVVRSPDPQFSGSSGHGYESEYNQRPNHQQSSGSFGQSSSNNRETQYSQRPNQEQSSGSFGHGSSSSNRESEYNQRPNQQFSGSSGSGSSNNRETQYNQRPNQQSSGSFGHGSGSSSNSNRETEYNQRPNQQSSGSFGQGGSSNGNNRETQYNQRPNQQQSSGSFGHGSSNNRESEYNQRPNQQSSGSFGHGSSNNREPEYNQRPNQQSSGSFGHGGSSSSNREPDYNQQPAHSGNTQHLTGANGTSASNKNPQGSNGKELCYNLFGCFSTAEPWYSKLRPVPGPLGPDQNRAEINFFSRPHTEQKYVINLYPEYSLGDAKFDAGKPTAIIIHGFIQGGDVNWMDKMKDAYLKRVDANVMIVDWRTGSQRLSYLQSAGNTRLIGRMVGYLIKSLVSTHGASPGRFHLIGHSLGAQIAAYAAKEVPGIGRLTALDPAQPGFEGFDKAVRLDRSDAEFVDVVHTNAKPFIPFFGLGMIKPHGHVDFYMNGGFDQPLCVAPSNEDLKPVNSILDLGNLPLEWFGQTLLCDHARAYAYFIEALDNGDCVFWGHKATIKKVAQTVANLVTQGLLSKYVALSGNCNVESCVPVGLGTELSPLRGSFVVTTNGRYPYCRGESGAGVAGKAQNDTQRDQNSRH